MTGVSFLGAGYVGLVTAICFADRGFNVILADTDTSRVEDISQGRSPFYETGLEELLKKVLGSKLRCLNSVEDAVSDTEISFITVGTPSSDDGEIDLKYVKQCSKEVGSALKRKTGYNLVVVKSTVVPGTTIGVVKQILESASGKTAGRDFGLCMSPEFLREGSAIQDTFSPDRVIIGGFDERSTNVLEDIIKRFYETLCPPLVKTTPSTAEMIKYASNAFLATKISLINEIANICESTPNVDVVTVAKGIGLDKRIGGRFLQAGVGFGGSCFQKDVEALTFYAESKLYKPNLLHATLKVNEYQADHTVELSKKSLGKLKDKRITVLGLSFKPETDDMREAPSIKIIQNLLREKAIVKAYDPKANNNAKAIFGEQIELASSAKDALKDADCCILVTEWKEFKELTPNDFREMMKNPIIIDGRRLYDNNMFQKSLRYIGIGLGPDD